MIPTRAAHCLRVKTLRIQVSVRELAARTAFPSHPGCATDPVARLSPRCGVAARSGLFNSLTSGLGGFLRRGVSTATRRMADAAGQGYGERWWGPDTVAVVTGANKGIGFHIACILAEQGLCVLATARDVSRGEEAASKLREAAAAAGNGGNVVFRKLDVASQASVDAFAEWLRREKPGGVTVVVNNAGLAYKGDIFGADEAENTINTNFYGVARVCDAGCQHCSFPSRGNEHHRC